MSGLPLAWPPIIPLPPIPPRHLRAALAHLHQALHLAMPPHEGAGHRRVRCCSQDERTGPETWKFFQDELLEEKRNSCSKHTKLEILGFPSFGGLTIQVSGLQILEMVGTCSIITRPWYHEHNHPLHVHVAKLNIEKFWKTCLQRVTFTLLGPHSHKKWKRPKLLK